MSWTSGLYKSLLLRSQQSLVRPDLALLDLQISKRTIQTMIGQQRVSCSSLSRAAETIAKKCDELFNANEFENALTTLYADGRPFGGQFAHGRFDMIKQRSLSVFEDTLGESLRPFMQQHSGVLEQVNRRQKELAAHVSRPLWKALRDRRQCDVQSVLVKERPQLTSLEKARRRASERLYNYNYLGRSAVDVALLRQLRGDRGFLDPLRLVTTPPMRKLAEEQFTIVRRLMKMLHARNPMYNRRYVRQRHGRIADEERRRWQEMHLFHAQYQTRRDCMRMLLEVQRRRREGDVDRLSDYVEQIMSGFVEYKTQRTLPWKWEFINDVYNTLALAHCDRCRVPANVDFLQAQNRPVLYLLQAEKLRDMSVRFGGPNIYVEIEKEDERHSRVKSWSSWRIACATPAFPSSDPTCFSRSRAATSRSPASTSASWWRARPSTRHAAATA
ncbi:uncharacterized protein LOC6550069 isoform X2 [Drosophila erecta]|uniref:uncharacterized protein LOC6550069 isoform X2 n=1 Tax=Drosophila erecta TaxID=7220 RepID=UPI000F04617B|nr:uncharacterized protein LOC6550069 isoform X2 [Drosophila erecta]